MFPKKFIVDKTMVNGHDFETRAKQDRVRRRRRRRRRAEARYCQLAAQSSGDALEDLTAGFDLQERNLFERSGVRVSYTAVTRYLASQQGRPWAEVRQKLHQQRSRRSKRRTEAFQNSVDLLVDESGDDQHVPGFSFAYVDEDGTLRMS